MKKNDTPLKDFCKIVQGGKLKLSGKDLKSEGFPAYGAGGINGYVETAEFNCEAIILSSIGARCGKCFHAEGEWTSLANTQIIFPDTDKADIKFLWHQLNDEKRWHRSGTGQPFIKPSDVKNHQAFLPPLEEQRLIAAILDKAERLRARAEDQINKADELLASLFIETIGDPLQNPHNWAAIPLAEAVRAGTNVTYGIVQAGEEFTGGVPYIRTGDIANGEIVTSGLRHTDPSVASRFPRSTVQTGEIVMSIRATVGTTAMVPALLNGANLTQGTARIAPGEQTDGLYLLQYLRMPSTQAWIQRQVKGATFREITLARLRELPVLLPSMEVQEAFTEKAKAARSIIESSKDMKKRAKSLYQSLVKQALG